MALIGGGAAEKAVLDAKLDAVIAVERLEQDKRVLWRPVSMFLTWSAPQCITSGLRCVVQEPIPGCHALSFAWQC